MDAIIELGAPAVRSSRQVTVTVTRDSDGEVVGEDMDAEYFEGDSIAAVSMFRAIESCSSGTMCEEAFTLTFTWVDGEPGESLAFDWSLLGDAQFELAIADPSDATLSIELNESPDAPTAPTS